MTTTLLAPLSDTEVREFAAAWYRKLDVHEPLEAYIPMLADKELKMIFPEATVEGFEGFKGWYERVITLFFDEVHTVKEVTLVSSTGEESIYKVVVMWEASMWNAPEPYSKRIILDAFQTWTVKRSTQTQQPIILTYVVDELVYAEESARL